MHVQDLIRAADSERIEEILRLAQQEPVDPDRLCITRGIIEEGLTPWLAAKGAFEEVGSGRSQKVLYYHARVINYEIATLLGYDPSGLMQKLRSEGEIICTREEARAIVEQADQSGLIVERELLERIRVIGDREEWRKMR